MANRKEYFYFIDTHTAGEKIAIVEKATNVVSKNGWTSNYQTVKTAGSNILKIRGSFLDSALVNNALDGSYSNIPARFHEAIVSKVIARGYKDPRHMELKTSQFFDNEFELGVKRAKKFSKGNYQTTGRIVPQDF
jgi:hypothetical protein